MSFLNSEILHPKIVTINKFNHYFISALIAFNLLFGIDIELIPFRYVQNPCLNNQKFTKMRLIQIYIFSIIFLRFLPHILDNTVFVTFCFITRGIQGVGFACYQTASLAMTSSIFSDNVAAATVSKIIFCVMFTFLLHMSKLFEDE